MNQPLSPDIVRRIADHVFAGQKIEAIKLYREHSGLGLKESKEFVDALEVKLRAQEPGRFAARPAGKGCVSVIAWCGMAALTAALGIKCMEKHALAAGTGIETNTAPAIIQLVVEDTCNVLKPLKTNTAPAIRLVGREVFFEAVSSVCVRAESFYTMREGAAKMRYRAEQRESDKNDALERSFSEDNGRTWSAPETLWVVRPAEGGGTERRGFKSGWVDPVTGFLLIMGGQGVLPHDKPADPENRGNMWYYVSTNGGRSFVVEQPVVQSGDHTPAHPFEDVWADKNPLSYGDRVGRPIRTRRGLILQPVQFSPLDKDGKRYNPNKTLTYSESAVLIGTWTNGCEIDWRLSQRVANDPARSSRGALEPTLAELPDGRILMVMRGSNDRLPGQPGYKWYSLSEDGGFTWAPIRPWTYQGGESFYSPSSCSQLVPHSSGGIYWIGNIVPQNPKGNLPRYPLVIGRVDPASGLLIRESVTTLDDRAPDESGERLLLSNFVAHEDRETKEILLHMSRPFTTGPSDWTSPAYLYRIAVAP